MMPKCLIVLVFTLTLSLALPTLAQQRAGGGGRAHDANTQVGSGGTNAAARQTDYRLRNNLVTGNVAGGTGFQGRIPYRAAGEFEGFLGSDTLFNFRARSLYSAPNQLNNVRAGNVNLANTDNLPNQGVYRSYTNLAAQTFGQSQSTTLYSQGGSSRFISPTHPATASLFAQAVQRERVGVTRPFSTQLHRTTTQILDIIDSPLLGIRQPRDSTITHDSVQKQIEERKRILNQNARIGERLYQIAAEQAEILEKNNAGPMSLTPTTILGRELQLAAMANNEKQRALDPEQSKQRAAMLHDSIFNPPTSAGQSVYNTLLENVRKQPTTSTDEPWKTTVDLPSPDDSNVKQAESSARKALRRAYGQNQDDAQGEEGEEMDLDRPFQTHDESVADILEQLNYDLPALNTLAGDPTTLAGELMQRAETEMVVGDFFKAQGSYHQVLLLTPDDPMAKVGLMHAQLGAGMIRSTALSLRRLFEAYPQLIATRYDPRLLPDEQRLQWVQGELNKLAEDPRSSGAPGLVMAYLGYQVRSRQLIRYGLALAQSHTPGDPLLLILRQIWLDPQETSQGTSQK